MSRGSDFDRLSHRVSIPGGGSPLEASDSLPRGCCTVHPHCDSIHAHRVHGMVGGVMDAIHGTRGG